MKLAKPQEKPLLVLLLKRASTLLFVWLLALLFLYVTGSVQGFLEKSMNSIMRLMTASAAFLVVLSFSGVLADLFLMLYKRRFRWVGGLVTYLVLMCFALFIALFSSGISVLSGGLGQ